MKPKLSHKSEFEDILRDYKPSSSFKDTLDTVNVTLLVGPSSSGRNRIIKELLKTGQYHQIISDTTRPPRSNDGVLEQNGVEYWFRDESDFLQDLKKGRFLEAAIIHDQQVSGVSIRELEQAAEDGKIAVNDIEVAGARNAQKRISNTKLIFILPPDFEVWMRRLDMRGAMTEEEKRARLSTAAREIARMQKEIEYYHVVVNDDLDGAVKSIRAISESNLSTPFEGSQEQAVASQLLSSIKSYLG